MAGVKGRSGGHNRLPVALHIQRGTYRPDRHGRPTATAPALQAGAIPTWVTEGLDDPGRRLCRDLYAEFDGWTSADLTLLRQAGRLLDDAEGRAHPTTRRLAILGLAAILRQLTAGRS